MNPKLVFTIISSVMLLFSIESKGLCENSTATTKRLLIVHSYEKDHICGQPQHDGAMTALAETDPGKRPRCAGQWLRQVLR
jgi:hypothetical protein